MPRTEITIEAVAQLKFTGICEGKSCQKCNSKLKQNLNKKETFNSNSSETSRDSVQVHCDFEDSSDVDLVDVNEMCSKWVEDVNKEKILNPSKMFLPHLLIP